MSRIPLRIITVTLEDDVAAVERIMDYLMDGEFCKHHDEDDEDNCALITASSTIHYMDEETGIEFDKAEGGAPIYTLDLFRDEEGGEGDWCGHTLDIPGDLEGHHGLTTCLQPSGHRGPHAGPITW